MEHLKVGQFIVGTNEIGAPLFTLSLVFQGGHVHGQGNVEQPVYPPLDLMTQLSGTSTSIIWGPDLMQIIHLVGHEINPFMPPYPVDLEGTIVLDQEKSTKGVATYRYRKAKGALGYEQWVEVKDVPVKVVWTQPQ